MINLFQKKLREDNEEDKENKFYNWKKASTEPIGIGGFGEVYYLDLLYLDLYFSLYSRFSKYGLRTVKLQQ